MMATRGPGMAFSLRCLPRLSGILPLLGPLLWDAGPAVTRPGRPGDGSRLCGTRAAAPQGCAGGPRGGPAQKLIEPQTGPVRDYEQSIRHNGELVTMRTKRLLFYLATGVIALVTACGGASNAAQAPASHSAPTSAPAAASPTQSDPASGPSPTMAPMRHKHHHKHHKPAASAGSSNSGAGSAPSSPPMSNGIPQNGGGDGDGDNFGGPSDGDGNT